MFTIAPYASYAHSYGSENKLDDSGFVRLGLGYSF